MNNTPIANSIVKIALAYANAKIREIEPNQGFQQKDYQSKITSIGWYPGAEWCAAAAILTWKEGYAINPAQWQKALRLVSLNSQQMARNFHNDPIWPTSMSVPRLGAIVVWQAGDSLTQGHTGIVVAIDGNTFTSVEGNTIPAGNPGNEREGYTIATHIHTLGLPHSSLKLNLDRFVYVVEAPATIINLPNNDAIAA